MKSTESLNILIVKLSSLGDVVQTIPVINDILSYYPNARIDWVVEEAFAPLLQAAQGLCRVIPISQRRWNRLGLKQWLNSACRTEKQVFFENLNTVKYDIVLDLQGLIKSGLVTRRVLLNKAFPNHFKCASTKPFRATYANRSDSCGYEWPVRWCTQLHIAMPRRIHAIQRTRLLCAKALGYSENILDCVPHYAWGPLDASTSIDAVQCPYIVLVHGSSRSDNAWPIQAWQTLAQGLIKQGLTVALPQSNDAELCNAQHIASVCGESAWIIERSDLLNMAKLIAHSHGIIGLDTGLSHLAVALNKPCVQIFLHDRAWRAGPLSGALGKAHQRWIGDSSAPPSAQAVLSEWQRCF